jgi:hypothetical protein
MQIQIQNENSPFLLILLVFFVWSYNPVLNFNWSVVVCLVIDYTGFGGSFYMKINKKPR